MLLTFPIRNMLSNEVHIEFIIIIVIHTRSKIKSPLIRDDIVNYREDVSE